MLHTPVSITHIKLLDGDIIFFFHVWLYIYVRKSCNDSKQKDGVVFNNKRRGCSNIGALRGDPNPLDTADPGLAESRILEAQNAARLAAFGQRRGRHFVARPRLLERRLARRQGHRIGRDGAARDDGTGRSVAAALDRTERAVEDARHASLVRRIRCRIVRMSAGRCDGHGWLAAAAAVMISSASIAAPADAVA